MEENKLYLIKRHLGNIMRFIGKVNHKLSMYVYSRAEQVRDIIEIAGCVKQLFIEELI